METESILIRDWKPEDKSFILASWLRGLYHGDSWFSLIQPRDAFFRNYHPVLENILANCNTTVKVACLKSDQDIIVGYAVFGFYPPNYRCLHWVYVKKAFRAIGVAKTLVPVPEVNTVTHLTRTGVSILYNHPEIQFNPFASNSQ